jgi:hypothetical protein
MIMTYITNHCDRRLARWRQSAWVDRQSRRSWKIDTGSKQVSTRAPKEPEMATREEMFVRYSDSIETLQAGESETVDQITATLLNIAKKVGERQRHTVRGVHAKSHGLLKAEYGSC